MSIRSSKTTSNPKPLVKFYTAEDLRQEIDGKVTAIGLYPDNVVVVVLPNEVPDPTKETPLAINSMGFLFNISKLSHQSKISIEIESGGERKPFMAPVEYSVPEPGRSINILGVVQPLIIASLGEKTLIVTVGKSEYRFPFEIRRGLIPDVGSNTPDRVIPSETKKRTRTPRTKVTKAK